MSSRQVPVLRPVILTVPLAPGGALRTLCPTSSSRRRIWRLRPLVRAHQDFGGAAFAADQLQADRFGASAGTISVGQVQSLFELAQSTVIQIAIQHHFVGLVHFEAGVGESVGQFAVVGQQQHPSGVGVETADREQRTPVG